MMSSFFSIKSDVISEIAIKKSKFIAWAVPVDNADKVEALLEEARQIWPGARHYCYAYIIREPYQEKFSDDGEPSGTAGLPILNVIKKQKFENVLIIVTRYFGGILLGASGLIRAYSSAASDALNKAEKRLFTYCQEVKAEISYAYWGVINHRCNLEQVLIDQIQFDTSVKVKFLIPIENVEKFIEMLVFLSNGTAVVMPGEKKYCSIKNAS
ncbi:YigZ family protein [Thermosyntropha sp.]|uniref:YigZ family protein n=1 Tax=Thermosyntropha sp. TaxID=2740820 RepID=UPI0025CB9AAB|nr:YigZ family protein [Thermosyntropha sp.]MBO8158339.1 YigZ family protein [Thermosyntropha sp.]